MEGSMLGGQWKVPCLVANGRFHAWWPMEGSMLGGQWKVHAWWPMEGPCLVANGRSMLGGQWKVPCLVANGRSMLGGQWKVPCLVANGMFQAWWPMECEGETPFHLFHFPPNNLYPNLQFFSFDFTVLLYHGPKPLFTPSFSFFSIYKSQLHTLM
jgi:hypothetical protein